MRSCGLGLMLAFVLGATAATGAPVVYHSPNDSGVRPAYPPHLPKASSVPLYLWIDPGPTATAGTVCINATGDASCAFDLRVQVQGDPKLTGFVPLGDAVYHPNPLTNASMLRVNRIATGQPLVGPQKIGQLLVDTTGPQGGLIEVTGVHSVGAARQLQALPSNTIAYVPEPGRLVLLVSGLAGLAVLHRLRGR